MVVVHRFFSFFFQAINLKEEYAGRWWQGLPSLPATSNRGKSRQHTVKWLLMFGASFATLALRSQAVPTHWNSPPLSLHCWEVSGCLGGCSPVICEVSGSVSLLCPSLHFLTNTAFSREENTAFLLPVPVQHWALIGSSNSSYLLTTHYRDRAKWK